MKHSSNNISNPKSRSNSQSSKSRSRSRSRSPSLQNEPRIANNNQENNRRNLNQHEGMLYLANIPINIPQQRIKQEFEKYGKVLNYRFYKKPDAQKPYYYGHITLERKSEAELAMKNITKEYNWTVEPYNRNNRNAKEKNNSFKERNMNFNNLNNNISSNI